MKVRKLNESLDYIKKIFAANDFPELLRGVPSSQKSIKFVNDIIDNWLHISYELPDYYNATYTDRKLTQNSIPSAEIIEKFTNTANQLMSASDTSGSPTIPGTMVRVDNIMEIIPLVIAKRLYTVSKHSGFDPDHDGPRIILFIINSYLQLTYSFCATMIYVNKLKADGQFAKKVVEAYDAITCTTLDLSAGKQAVTVSHTYGTWPVPESDTLQAVSPYLDFVVSYRIYAPVSKAEPRKGIGWNFIFYAFPIDVIKLYLSGKLDQEAAYGCFCTEYDEGVTTEGTEKCIPYDSGELYAEGTLKDNFAKISSFFNDGVSLKTKKTKIYKF